MGRSWVTTQKLVFASGKQQQTCETFSRFGLKLNWLAWEQRPAFFFWGDTKAFSSASLGDELHADSFSIRRETTRRSLSCWKQTYLRRLANYRSCPAYTDAAGGADFTSHPGCSEPLLRCIPLHCMPFISIYKAFLIINIVSWHLRESHQATVITGRNLERDGGGWALFCCFSKIQVCFFPVQ